MDLGSGYPFAMSTMLAISPSKPCPYGSPPIAEFMSLLFWLVGPFFCFAVVYQQIVVMSGKRTLDVGTAPNKLSLKKLKTVLEMGAAGQTPNDSNMDRVLRRGMDITTPYNPLYIIAL